MRCVCLLAAFGVMFGVYAVAAQQPAARQPLVREEALEKISAHVFWIPDDDVPQVSNIGIVVGDRGTLVIDTGLGPRNGAAAASAAAKVSHGGESYLAMTHFHPEHDLGAQGFPAATRVIRWTRQDGDLVELGLEMALNFALQTPFNTELMKGTNFRRTDVSFEREYRLDLGGVHVRLIGVGPAHTRGDTVFAVEEDGVVFAGDVVMPAFPAFIAPYSSVRAWTTALDRVDALKPKVIVPSHGRRGDVSMITAYREYFSALRQRAAELKKQGTSVDDAAAVMQKEMPGRFSMLAYRGANRVSLAARSAYQETP